MRGLAWTLLFVGLLSVCISGCSDDFHLTFVSGNDHHADSSFWKEEITRTIEAQRKVAQTDMLLWLGNAVNLYSPDSRFLVRDIDGAFEQLKNDTYYKQFVEEVVESRGGKVDGCLDVIDAGRQELAPGMLSDVKKTFLSFVSESTRLESDIEAHAGLYHFTPIPTRKTSPLYPFFVNSVCLVVLDTMGSRGELPNLYDTLLRRESNEVPPYSRSNTTGAASVFEDDLLGELQWEWLERIVETYIAMDSEKVDGRFQCAVTVIASAWQILLNDNKPYFGWDLYPASRSRLLDLLKRKNASRFLFLSGHAGAGELGFVYRSAKENIFPKGIFKLYAQRNPITPATKQSVALLPAKGSLVEATSSGLKSKHGHWILAGISQYAVAPTFKESESPTGFFSRYVSLDRTALTDLNFGTLMLSQTGALTEEQKMNYDLVVATMRVSVDIYAMGPEEESDSSNVLHYEAALNQLPSYEPSPTLETVPRFSVYGVPAEYPYLKKTLLASQCPEFPCTQGKGVLSSTIMANLEMIILMVVIGLVLVYFLLWAIWKLLKNARIPRSLKRKANKVKQD